MTWKLTGFLWYNGPSLPVGSLYRGPVMQSFEDLLVVGMSKPLKIRVDLPVILYALTLVWRHCNDMLRVQNKTGHVNSHFNTMERIAKKKEIDGFSQTPKFLPNEMLISN